MMRPLSDDLHKRVVGTVQVCESCRWRCGSALLVSFCDEVAPALEQAPPTLPRRQGLRAVQPGLYPAWLCFIEETWIKNNIVALCGWVPKGKLLRPLPA